MAALRTCTLSLTHSLTDINTHVKEQPARVIYIGRVMATCDLHLRHAQSGCASDVTSYRTATRSTVPFDEGDYSTPKC